MMVMDIDIGQNKNGFETNLFLLDFPLLELFARNTLYTYKRIYEIKHKSQLIHAILNEITELLKHFFVIFRSILVVV